MSNFAFLQTEFVDQYDAAIKAETAVHSDPRTACFYARRALELALRGLQPPALRLPYQDNLWRLIHEPTFKQAAGEAVFNKARVIDTLGNRAVHSHRPIPTDDALVAVRELFHVCYWLARTYGRAERARARPRVRLRGVAQSDRRRQQTAEQLGQLETSLRERDEKLAAAPRRQERTGRGARAAARRGRRRRSRRPLRSRTRTTTPRPRPATTSSTCCSRRPAGRSTSRATGSSRSRACRTTQGKGFVDYVLWGDDGKPLALVEAKRTRRIRASASSRRSSTPIAWSSSSASGR